MERTQTRLSFRFLRGEIFRDPGTTPGQDRDQIGPAKITKDLTFRDGSLGSCLKSVLETQGSAVSVKDELGDHSPTYLDGYLRLEIDSTSGMGAPDGPLGFKHFITQ